jgi:CDP-glycerol glycerophosphotransferase (TagB/SpsB family)
MTSGSEPAPRRYLLYGSERYAVAILAPLQEAMRRRGDEAGWFFDGPGGSDLEPDDLLLRTVRDVKSYNPLAVFVPGNHVPDFFPGVKVEVFHGFNAGKPQHIWIRGFYDLYCTTGPQDTRDFQELADRLGHFCVRETGWPKLDPFADRSSPRTGDRPTVLYHSTFSPRWSAAPVLYDTIRRLSRSGRWNWVVTFHPKMNPEIVAKYRALEGDHLTFSEVDNILELYGGADVMISDTSSALSEFLLWRKPVVTFKNRRPGPYLIDIDDPDALEGAVERALARPPELMQAIRTYGDETHPYRDGRSSERVLEAVDAFIAAGARNRRPKPLNLIRRWKIRRRLGYYHLR